MKTYQVTLYFHSNATIQVMAENEQDALNKARNMDLEDQIQSGLIEEGNDVDLVKNS